MSPTTPITHEVFDNGRTLILHMNGLPLAKLVHDGQAWLLGAAIPSGTKSTEWDVPKLLDVPADADAEDALMAALVIAGRPDYRRAPRFAQDKALWAHVKAKNPKAYDEWEPKDFGAAQTIYRHSLRKYGTNNPELAARYGIDLDAR